MDADPGPFLLSPFVLAETDYLLLSRVGTAAESAFLGEVASGAYQLEPFDQDDVGESARIVERYASLRIGIADASLVVIAARSRTHRLLTLDERHFRTVRPLRGHAFTLLPSDA